MKLTGIKILGLFALAALITISCKKEDQMEIDQQLINDFLIERGWDAQSTDSGLYYVIEEPGSDDHPTIQDVVTVSYIGLFLDGSIFDVGTDITFPLTNVIRGWQEGIPLFGKGGKGWLIVPSHLAYGNTLKPGIPPNSVLAFQVELIDF
jgi:FKBP-type peptidyl-prolyl cis-trans isomerase FkpA